MDYVLIDGDDVIFEPKFGEAGEATVVVQPVKLKASGPTTLSGKKVCVQGNERSVSVDGCTYTTTTLTVPGTGILEIAAIGSDQLATKSLAGKKKLLLVGSGFTARFRVGKKAQAPNGTSVDAMTEYSGSGKFTTQNTKFRAT